MLLLILARLVSRMRFGSLENALLLVRPKPRSRQVGEGHSSLLTTTALKNALVDSIKTQSIKNARNAPKTVLSVPLVYPQTRLSVRLST